MIAVTIVVTHYSDAILFQILPHLVGSDVWGYPADRLKNPGTLLGYFEYVFDVLVG